MQIKGDDTGAEPDSYGRATGCALSCSGVPRLLEQGMDGDAEWDDRTRCASGRVPQPERAIVPPGN
jgi:hypothetical protein